MLISTLKLNVLANFGGKAWIGLIQLVFVPLYIKFLGMEAFGLIGFFIMLQGLLSLLDLGLSTTLNRELACRSANGNAQEARDLVRTLEWIYWSIAIGIAAGIMAAAPWIAGSWVNVKGLPASSVQHAIVLMGLVAAAQWPYSLYSGGLMGLQKQVLLNTIRACMATIQAVGAVLVLWLIAQSIEAYFLWQILIVGIQTMLTGYYLRSSLPKSAKAATFSRDLLRQCWRFAAGMTAISSLIIILTQTDKIILSKLLPLDQFGYYMLAFTLGNAFIILVSPVSTALFPKLSELVATENISELIRLYHKGCQVVSLFAFPAGVLIALFPREILILWTHDVQIAENTRLLLSLVIAGYVFNAAVTIPYMLQLAYGWTSLAFYKNVVAIIVLIPLMFFLIHYLGAVGGAITWVLLNLGYVMIEVPIMHRRLLPGEKWAWYRMDIGYPLVISLLIIGMARFFIPSGGSLFLKLPWLVMAALLALVVSASILPVSRNWIRNAIHGRIAPVL